MMVESRNDLVWSQSGGTLDKSLCLVLVADKSVVQPLPLVLTSPQTAMVGPHQVPSQLDSVDR